MRRLLPGLLLLWACEDAAQIGQLRPELVLVPAAGTPLVFAQAILQKSVPDPIIIRARNDGAAPLRLGWHLEGQGEVLVSSFPKVLEPGNEGELWVRFRPTIPTDASPVLVLESNDPTQPEARFPLDLHARALCRLEGWPTHLRFKVGQTQTVSLLAAGTSDCYLRDISLDEDTFELVDPPALPLLIPAGTEAPIAVRHTTRTGLAGVPIRELRLRDEDANEVKVTLEGAYPLWNCLQAFPREIRFEDTTLGFTRERNITVTNRCTEPATLSSAAVFYGYHAFFVGADPFPIYVPALGAVDVRALYRPFDEDGDAGNILLNSDDAARPRLEVLLAGKAIYPGIRTLPSLDLGPVGLIGGPPSRCGSRVGRLPIWSTGKGPLLIDGITVDGADAGAFEYLGAELNGAPLAGPGQNVIVPVGEKAELLFRFRPLRAAPVQHSARLHLNHYALSGPHEVTLLGTTAGLGLEQETFVVAPPKLDVLFAVDDSRSMTSEQERLVTAAARWVEVADAAGADYQLAATRTEAESSVAGQLKGCTNQDPIVRSSDGTSAERAARLGCMMRTGRRGDRPETGLGAAALAIDRALFPTPTDPSTSVNARFLRPDTRLVVVTASDEDDQSPEAIPALLDYFRAARADQIDRFQFHALAGLPGQSCPSDPFLNPGDRYAQMCTAAGGVLHDLCTPDYAPALTDLAERALVPSSVFELSGPVNETTLVVTLDGTRLAPDPNGYRYDPGPNTITLQGTATPTVGQTVQAQYRGECLP